MIKKPSLLRSVTEEGHRMQSEHTDSQRRFLQRCTCRALFRYRRYGHSIVYGKKGISMLAPWNVVTFSSSLIHHRDCVLSRESQETKQFGLRIAFGGPLLRGAIHAAMSMTRGSGGFSLSPALTFNYVVPSNTGQFKLLNSSLGYALRWAPAADVRTAFEFRRRELLRLYQEGKASPSDVDENGETVMHVSL